MNRKSRPTTKLSVSTTHYTEFVRGEQSRISKPSNSTHKSITTEDFVEIVKSRAARTVAGTIANAQTGGQPLLQKVEGTDSNDLKRIDHHEDKSAKRPKPLIERTTKPTRSLFDGIQKPN